TTHRRAQLAAQSQRPVCLTRQPAEAELTRLRIEHRCDHLRRMHVEPNQGPSLGHVGALLWSCGPPPRPSSAARTHPTLRGGGAGLFYCSRRTFRPYGLALGDEVTVAAAMEDREGGFLDGQQ